jgi:hypothetical protein
MLYEVEELREKINCVVTATCIPFEWNKTTQVIKTFLYLNPKYTTKEWMFPGGHAFTYKEHWFPEEVAQHKASCEVGTEVNIINLDDEKEEETEVDICIKKSTPHFVYYITQRDSVECYKKGHKFHYDCIYIGDVTKRENVDGTTLEIDIPIATTTFEEINTIVSNTIKKKGMDEDTKIRNISYVSKMLFNAFINYKKHIQKDAAK